MLKRNPSRMVGYITMCVEAEDMFRIRAALRRAAAQRQA
jgi:hypothetical protein